MAAAGEHNPAAIPGPTGSAAAEVVPTAVVAAPGVERKIAGAPGVKRDYTGVALGCMPLAAMPNAGVGVEDIGYTNRDAEVAGAHCIHLTRHTIVGGTCRAAAG